MSPPTAPRDLFRWTPGVIPARPFASPHSAAQVIADAKWIARISRCRMAAALSSLAPEVLP